MRFLVEAIFCVASAQWGWFGGDSDTDGSTASSSKVPEPTQDPVESTTTTESPMETQTETTTSPGKESESQNQSSDELEETEDEKIAANFPIGQCSGTQQTLRECKVSDCDPACIDCQWDTWSSWSACMCNGLKERSRVIKLPNNDCGKVCEGSLVETATCVPACQKAVEDCALSEWSDWDSCDKGCEGQTLASRHVRTKATNGGKSCEGQLRKTIMCGEKICDNHVNCVLGPWQPWGTCSRTCGHGQQQRHRTIQKPASMGLPCTAELQEIRGCSETPCGKEVDCLWGDWENWGACSRTCGGGQKNRNRVVKVSPREGGKLCSAEVSSETETCNTLSCIQAADCIMGQWGPWDACSCTANGIRRRNRQIQKYSQEDGKGCEGSLKEVEGCNQDFELSSSDSAKLPVDCVLGEWDDWSQCSVSCGIGAATRRRNIVTEQAHGGDPCEGSLSAVKGCNDGACDRPIQATTTTTQDAGQEPAEHEIVDCEWSHWDSWSACSVSCGGGQRNRLRQIVKMCDQYGKPCGHHSSMEIEACETHACGCKDCVWSEWGEWAACTCGGLQESHRRVKDHESSCGKPCVGEKVKTQACEPHCDQESRSCQWDSWSAWSACTAECGGGQSQRRRSIKKHAHGGGRACFGSSREALPCNVGVCGEPEDCLFDDWSGWSRCPVTCGGAEQFRHRSIQKTSVSGGKGCKGFTKEVRACGEASCANVQDCKWGQWSTYSPCSASCGGGMKQRDRSISQAPRNFGKLCSAEVKSEVISCNTQSCSDTCVDASWGSWGPFGRCSGTCGKTYRSRSRTIAVQANECGKSVVGDFQEYSSCPEVSCSLNMHVINCGLSEWTEWTDCSCTCDGIKERSRRVSQYAVNGGEPCTGSLKTIAPCNAGACMDGKNEDCVLGEWSSWRPCSSSCGGGVQKQSRRVNVPQSGSGLPCENDLARVQGCGYISCTVDVDCKWGEWTTWSDCTKKCGGGQRNRYRHIEVLPENNGKSCEIDANSETQGCNHGDCGQRAFCGWASWNNWGSCSTTCGWGSQKRVRHLDVNTEANQASEFLSSGVLNEIFHMSDAAMEKLFGSFIAGLCVSGVLLSFVHRMVHSSVSYTRVLARPE